MLINGMSHFLRREDECLHPPRAGGISRFTGVNVLIDPSDTVLRPEERPAGWTARRVGKRLSDRSGRVALTVCGEQLDDEERKGNFPPSGLGLGVGLVRHHARHLLHPYGSGLEVDGVPAQAHAFTPAESGAGGQADECPVATGGRGGVARPGPHG